MSATRAVLDAVTTALKPKLLDGPSWAVGPAKTAASLWAAEVIDMFGRRGVLAIVSISAGHSVHTRIIVVSSY